ncbi:TolC family protein [Aliidiomarina indica]|uniref:TolC family protein n=1 Tax=Aliidiomarina indica TaxID=2749147 RepID=UPI00188F644B|nr:TolC family protein [Aliidiomarina indica]
MYFYRHPLRCCALLVVIALSGCASYQPDYSGIDAVPTTQQALPLPVDAHIADLIRYAQKHHPLVRAAQADLERAEANMTASGAFMDPEVSLSQGLNDTGYRTLAVSQDIPIFQRRSMAMEQARAEYRAGQARLAQVQADIAANVMTAFSEYLYVQENAALQQELISLLSHVVHVVEQQYAAGNGAMSDLLRAQNTLDAARSDYENLKALLVSQQARLNSALGRDARAALPEHFSLQKTHENYAQLPAPEDDLYALAHEQNATLLATQYELQALHVGRDVASRAGLPRLMLGIEYMDTEMGDGTFAGMVSFSLPIWRSNYRALQEAASANVKSGEARLQAARLEVQAELSMALYQWREAERDRQLYGEVLVRRAEQAVASILSQYSNSNASFADVIASQQEWLSFSLAYRRALANQLAAVATIQSLIVPATHAEVSP